MAVPDAPASAPAAISAAAGAPPPAAGWRVQLRGSWWPEEDARADSNDAKLSGLEPWGDEPAVVRLEPAERGSLLAT